jgi:hypothetical protein
MKLLHEAYVGRLSMKLYVKLHIGEVSMESLYQSLIVTEVGVNPKSNNGRCTGPGPEMNSQAKKKNQRAI